MLSSIDLQSGNRGHIEYIYELESLRGVAILLVIFFHAYGVGVGANSWAPNWLNSFVLSGSTGVTLFFVLSGFLLSAPWINFHLNRCGFPPSISSFYISRILRIFPLYYFSVGVAVFWSGNFQAGSRAALFQFIGFDIFPFSVVWWTLTTEIQFYLLLPVFMLSWGAGRYGKSLVVLILLAWCLIYCFATFSDWEAVKKYDYWIRKSLFGRLPAFLLGAAACGLYYRYRSKVIKTMEFRGSELCALAIICFLVFTLGCILLAVAEMGGRAAETQWHIHHFYESSVWALLILCLLLFRPVGRRILVNRFFAVTGKLSYSLYVVHLPVLFFLIYPAKTNMGAEFTQSGMLYLLLIIAVIISYFISWLTFRMVELPFLNWKKRRSDKMDRGGAIPV